MKSRVLASVLALALISGCNDSDDSMPMGPEPQCAVSPEWLHFGRVSVGSTMELSFSLRNIGGGILTGTIVHPACPDFRILYGNCNYNLAAGESLVVTLQFIPGSEGEKACRVNTGDCGSLYCTGIAEGPPQEPGMALVPAGEFVMGDGMSMCGMEMRQIRLTRDFYLGQNEVTNQQYADAIQWAYDNGYVDATSSAASDKLDGSSEELLDLDDSTCEISFGDGLFQVDAGKETHPVIEVTWFGAAAYCDWLSLQADRPRAYDHSTWECNSGNPYGAEGYRLPTDAEWEYAAQYGHDGPFPWGADGPSCDKAAFLMCAMGTMPTGSYPAAPIIEGQELFDLAGNVFEWCNDYYDCMLGTSPEDDPIGSPSGLNRVLRGGSWRDGPPFMRCSSRYGSGPELGNFTYGFRVARTVTP